MKTKDLQLKFLNSLSMQELIALGKIAQTKGEIRMKWKKKNGAYRMYNGVRQVVVKEAGDVFEVYFRDASGHWESKGSCLSKDEAKSKGMELIK